MSNVMGNEFPKPPTDLFNATRRPSSGSYQGPLPAVDLEAVRKERGRWFSLQHHKRWMYFFATKDDMIVVMAITNLGYAASAFLNISSSKEGLLVDASYRGIPNLTTYVNHSPEQGCTASHQAMGDVLRVFRAENSKRYEWAVYREDVQLNLRLNTEQAPEPWSAVVQLPDGDTNVTSKRMLLPVTGSMDYKGRSFDFQGGWGGMDFTEGFLPRKTRWRWAFGMGKGSQGELLGFNVVEGFNGAPECILYVNGHPIPLQEAIISYNPDDLAGRWHITTKCNTLDLVFTSQTIHTERQHLGIVHIDFVQPIGSFQGSIRPAGQAEIKVEQLAGVVENQSVVW
jgi:hypothetical protein